MRGRVVVCDSATFWQRGDDDGPCRCVCVWVSSVKKYFTYPISSASFHIITMTHTKATTFTVQEKSVCASAHLMKTSQHIIWSLTADKVKRTFRDGYELTCCPIHHWWGCGLRIFSLRKDYDLLWNPLKKVILEIASGQYSGLHFTTWLKVFEFATLFTHHPLTVGNGELSRRCHWWVVINLENCGLHFIVPFHFFVSFTYGKNYI